MDCDDGYPEPGPAEAAPILRYLPLFEADGFVAGRPRGGVDDGSGIIEWPWVEYAPVVSAFVAALYDHGWIVPFDWGSWQLEAEWLVVSGQVDMTDVGTLRRVLTVIVRSDRFCEGTLLRAFDDGLIVRILRRLNALAAADSSPRAAI